MTVIEFPTSDKATGDELRERVREAARRARQASAGLAQATRGAKDALLQDMAAELVERAPEVLEANERDVAAARESGTPEAMIDRLSLSTGRVEAMAVGLRANGVTVEDTRDTMTVHGAAQVAGGGHAVTHLDHRIAMSFLILGLATQQPVPIDDAGPITTSFPDFVPLMTRLGATLD